MSETDLQKHCRHFRDGLFGDSSTREALKNDFVAAGEMALPEAFEVYRGGYSARAVEALGETYETLWMFLGDEEFFKCVENYIRENPSQSANLNHWGKNFPEFIRQHFEDPMVFELARFCKVQDELFHSPSSTIPIREAPEFLFQRSYEIFSSPLQIHKLWSAIRNNSELESPIEENCHLIVYLKNYQVYFAECPADPEFLQALRDFSEDELSIEDFFTQVRSIDADAADEAAVQQLFQALSELGIFAQEAADK